MRSISCKLSWCACLRWLFFAMVITSVALPMSASAGESTWSATFQTDGVSSHLEAGPLAYVLIGAGQVPTDEAAGILIRALSTSARVKLTMDAAALGDVKALADEQIVKKASALPVDRVMILRVFAGTETTAVVTIYDKSGESRGAFTGVAGRALAKSDKQAGGVTAAAADSVSAIIDDTTEMTDEQKKKYLEQALVLERQVGVYGNQYGIWTSTWQVPRIGQYGKPISWKDFFKRVERDDLAMQIQKVDDYSGVRTVGTVAFSVGYLSIISGSTLVILAYGAGGKPEYKTAAWACMGGGAGLAIIGHLIHFFGPDYPEVPAHEVREMVDKHNTKLQKELSIGQASQDSDSIQVLAAPMIGPDFGGLTVAFRF